MQDRQLGRALPASEKGRDLEPKPSAAKVCVTGLDTFAMAATRALAVRLDADDEARRQALAAISRAAVRARRFVEQSAPAPTLPKRLGTTTEDQAGRRIPRVPVDPARPACDGQAYAWFPLDARGGEPERDDSGDLPPAASPDPSKTRPIRPR